MKFPIVLDNQRKVDLLREKRLCITIKHEGTVLTVYASKNATAGMLSGTEDNPELFRTRCDAVTGRLLDELSQEVRIMSRLSRLA